MTRHRRRAHRPVFDRLDGRRLLSALTPAGLATAYGLNAITFTQDGTTVKGDGSGETIAIIDPYHDPYLASDLNTFDAAYGLPSAALAQVDLAGSTVNSGWAGEETLDVEWAHALAPGANIVVVEARSDSTRDLLAAVDVAREIPSVSVISMSWGGSEFKGQVADDAAFTTPAGHQGITFVAAAGDDGASGGAEWPASAPGVLAVGGTTLDVGYGGTYLGESVWYGSSGGLSKYEGEPTYQSAAQATGSRLTPDVTFDADPRTGVMTYTTDPATGFGGWSQVGGTSLGARAWAALVAIADQGRVLAGQGTLDGGSQTLPALYTLPSADFHAVSGLGDGVSAGLGSPDGAAVVEGLATYSGSVPLTTTTEGIKAASVKLAHKKKVHVTHDSLRISTPSDHPRFDARHLS